MNKTLYLIALLFLFLRPPLLAQTESVSPSLVVKKCQDFQISGKGDHTSWSGTTWMRLTQLDSSNVKYASRFKILYSPTGIYVLFSGTDNKITTKDYNDFENIFNGDVFEVFFHPHTQTALYYEYEINAMSKELILAISNQKEFGFQSWMPRKSNVKKMVSVSGGKPEINGTIESWTAEIFFPFAGLAIIPGVPPASGTTWRANFCRLDYDSGKMIKWSYSPHIKTSFHELEAFYTIKFE